MAKSNKGGRPKKAQHVVPAPGGGWSVKKAGAKKASKHYETKEAAVKRGREISKNQGAELYIHRKDGTIERKASHGKDRNPPKDRDTHK